MTQLIVSSRNNLSKLDLNHSNFAIISISDSADNFVGDIENARGTLWCAFHDIDKDYQSNDAVYYAMNAEQANKVSDFVKRWWNDVETLIVQCDAGISRSAGVAAAISKWATDNDREYFNSGKYVPNRNCYRLTLNALME